MTQLTGLTGLRLESLSIYKYSTPPHQTVNGGRLGVASPLVVALLDLLQLHVHRLRLRAAPGLLASPETKRITIGAKKHCHLSRDNVSI